MDLIDKEQWSSLDADVKGDVYEGLLQKNAEDVKGGAGQYFTPRALIAAMVDVMAPKPGQTICDPACGTGGFLLAAYTYLVNQQSSPLDRSQKKALKSGTFQGIELVDSVTRLCAMNLLLHGIGGDSDDDLPVIIKDALAGKHGEYDMVLANPPFGKKSSVTIINEVGEQSKGGEQRGTGDSHPGGDRQAKVTCCRQTPLPREFHSMMYKESETIEFKKSTAELKAAAISIFAILKD